METKPSTVARPSRLQLVATLMASSVFMLPLVIGKAVELFLKGTNPDNVDVTQGLAYLSPMLITSFVTFGLWLVASGVVVYLLHRRDAAAARLPWLVLGSQMLLGLLFLALQGVLNGITSQ